MENKVVKQDITDCEETFLQGNANGKRLNSSITTSKNGLQHLDDIGPLKSMEILSQGRVAFMSGVLSGL